MLGMKINISSWKNRFFVAIESNSMVIDYNFYVKKIEEIVIASFQSKL